jgi:hypothetical protein
MVSSEPERTPAFNDSGEMITGPARSPTGENLIDQDEWADCWICEDIFRRRTQTKRYCAKCHRGFCEGWHGSLARGYGTCIICEKTTDQTLSTPAP